MSSKIDFKSPIGLALCTICLKEFYNLYDEEGCGIITNTHSGAMLYDLLKFIDTDLTINEDIKKQVIEFCKSDYLIIQDRTIKDKEKHKKLYQEYCKCKLIEMWLNIKADEGKVIKPPDTYIPKLDAMYHKIRLRIREQ